MFTINKILTRPQKFILEQNFKNYLYNSVNNYQSDLNKYQYDLNKYNKLMSKINEDNKRKKDIQGILYGTTLTKTTNHSVNDLINNSKYHNFIFIVSFVSIGALIFYKNR